MASQNDDLNANSIYQFKVLDENGNGVAADKFSGLSFLLYFRFPPQAVQIQRSIRSEVQRDIGLGYSIVAGGEGIGNIQISGTHGVGPYQQGESLGLQKRNEFRAFFKAFIDANNQRGKEGLPLLQMTFKVFGGNWSNLRQEEYWVWPDSYPGDSRTAARPHAWDWSIRLSLLAERNLEPPTKDNQTVLSPNASIKAYQTVISALEGIQNKFKKYTSIFQQIRDVINFGKSIINGIQAFVSGTKDFIYSVSDLIRSSAQAIQTLLKALDISAFLDDANNALRGALYEARLTNGQIKIAAIQFERAGLIPPVLTNPQTASVNRPIVAFANPGDSLASIAQRTLGDSTQWPKLVSINDLDYPYLDFSGPFGAADPAFAAAGLNVAGNGTKLKIPLPVTPGTVPISLDPFGTDLQDIQSSIGASPAPEALASGLSNLAAAIIRRLLTPKGKIPWMPDYGSLLQELLGSPQALDFVETIQSEVARVMSSDPRILSVQSVETQIDAGSVLVQASVLTPLGPLDIAFPAAA